MSGHKPGFKEVSLRTRLVRIAFDEDRARCPGQPSDTGPLGHFGLGHEVNAFARVQRKDIQPAGVIGHNCTALCHEMAVCGEAHAQDTKGVSADELGYVRRDWTAQTKDWPFDKPYQEQNEQAPKDKGRKDGAADYHANPSHRRNVHRIGGVITVPRLAHAGCRA